MKEKFTTYIALIFTVLFWGLSFIGTKIALTSFSPFVCIFLRFSLASCFFLFLLFKYGFPSLSAKDHKKLLLLALFQPGLYFTFETIGLTYTSASKASIILAMVPLAVMVLARLIIGEEITRKSLSGICLSVLGIIVLVLGEPGFDWSFKGSLYGDILILGAVISAAFYMVFTRDLGKTLSSMEITGFQVIYGTIIFAPLFFAKLPGIKWAAVSAQSIGGFLLYNFALTRITASKASVFINGIPVVTAVGAWIILGERLGFLQIIGGIIVLFAVFITNVSSIRKANTGKATSLSARAQR